MQPGGLAQGLIAGVSEAGSLPRPHGPAAQGWAWLRPDEQLMLSSCRRFCAWAQPLTPPQLDPCAWHEWLAGHAAHQGAMTWG